jgi:hypothetical protein
LKIGGMIETESSKNFKGLLFNKADRDEVEKI